MVNFTLIGAVLSYFDFFLTNIEYAVCLTLVTFCATFLLKQNRLLLRLIRRDVSAVCRLIRMKLALKEEIDNETTIGKLFRKCVARHPTKIMIRTKDRQYTFKEAEDYANRVANYFSLQGFGHGDTVSLYMENRPEYVFIWLGLSNIGVCTALINTNIQSGSLAHCLKIVDTKALIFSPSTTTKLLNSINDIREVNSNLPFYVFGEDHSEMNAIPIEKAIEASSNVLNDLKGRLEDKLVYIFTSGTTGLPKAAIIKHRRYLEVAFAATHILRIRPNDVYYVYLPFYHLAATCLGISQTLLRGCTAVVVPKFSASKFWSDCEEYGVTVTQYIGEICRYLLAQPERDSDRRHKVRMVYGNGLRKELWTQFKDRFALKDIYELYGSTEGTSKMVNLDNTAGAIGFFPLLTPLVRKYIPDRIIRVDPETNVPIRDANGWCIDCEDGEIGEIVAIIRNDPMSKFDGYADQKATDKKIYRDCFSKGDRVFSSGDLVYKDRNGYVYFSDRLGDTFRWKGENVSTTEVETVIAKAVNDPSIGCCVYGVQVAGTEGRAGMAAIIDSEEKLDPQAVLKVLKELLPLYAIPVFLRMTKVDNVTATYKMSKVSYQKESFDLTKCRKDPVYFLEGGKYVRMDAELQGAIENGQVKL